MDLHLKLFDQVRERLQARAAELQEARLPLGVEDVEAILAAIEREKLEATNGR